MRRFFAFLFVFLCVFPGGCTSKTTKPQQKAAVLKQVSADPFTWDFGKAEEKTVLAHEFILKNNGKKPLNITGTHSSCGCAVSEAKKKALQPGESTTIEVKFNTKGYYGQVSQFIYVNTDDPVDPVIKFTVKAEVTAAGGGK
ncbi:MAG: DUF1573 domain-containing protein [Candidatus Omnitrophica bacterium]|nr:DUF1573 domain-containing protein [Candidatus Omnitrophota bacterium]